MLWRYFIILWCYFIILWRWLIMNDTLTLYGSFPLKGTGVDPDLFCKGGGVEKKEVGENIFCWCTLSMCMHSQIKQTFNSLSPFYSFFFFGFVFCALSFSFLKIQSLCGCNPYNISLDSPVLWVLLICWLFLWSLTGTLFYYKAIFTLRWNNIVASKVKWHLLSKILWEENTKIFLEDDKTVIPILIAGILIRLYYNNSSNSTNIS